MTKTRLVVLVAFVVGVSCLYAAEEKVTLEGTLVSSASIWKAPLTQPEMTWEEKRPAAASA